MISPCLLNVALHGMEHAAGVRYRNSARSDAETVRGCPVLVRYADDYVAMCYSREQAEQVQGTAGRVAGAERAGGSTKPKPGSSLLTEGFDFLGFDICRRYRRATASCSSSRAPRRSQEVPETGLPKEFRVTARGQRRQRYWRRSPRSCGAGSAYYRSGGVRPGCSLPWTDHLWKRHLQVGVLARAPEQAQSAGSSAGTSESSASSGTTGGYSATGDTGAYLPKPSWTDIVRHTLVTGGASPDDPALAGYWAQRRQKVKPPLDSYTVRLLSRQTVGVEKTHLACALGHIAIRRRRTVLTRSAS